MDINNIKIDDVPTTNEELAAYEAKFPKTQTSIDAKMAKERQKFIDKQPSDKEMEEKLIDHLRDRFMIRNFR